MSRRFVLPLVARGLRFCVVVPLTALTLHRLQPEVSWWSWYGVSALSLLLLWTIDGCIAFSRWSKQRRQERS